jgi:hypothetical protein
MINDLCYRYMRPNTPHYVLTAQDAIIYGHHFFSASTVQSTTFGIIHCFIHKYGVTNTSHDNIYTFLRRLMVMWQDYYRDPAFDPSQHPHIPNVMTHNGLLDLAAIGNLVEISPMIDRRCYKTTGVHHLEWSEMGHARWAYQMLQSNVCRHFSFKVGSKLVYPLLFFQRSLVEFAAAIVTYMEDVNPSAKSEICTPTRLKEKMVKFFQSNYPELLWKLRHLIDNRFEHLVWNGPKITITKYSKEHRPSRPNQQDIWDGDFTDSPLYPSESLENMWAEERKKSGDGTIDYSTESDRPAKRLRHHK